MGGVTYIFGFRKKCYFMALEISALLSAHRVSLCVVLWLLLSDKTLCIQKKRINVLGIVEQDSLTQK